MPSKTPLGTRSELRAQAQFLPGPTPRVRLQRQQRKKSFKDGKVVEEAFVEAADALFSESKNKTDIVAAIKDVQLSSNTVTQRCEGMAEGLEEQLKN